MPSYIITPNGSVVAASGGGNPVLLNNTITWNGVVEKFPSAQAALIYFTNLTNLMQQQTSAGAFVQNLFLPVLYSVTPNSFELPSTTVSTVFNTTHITILGAGFSPYPTSYTLYIEDAAGGIDTNGYRLTPLTFVNQNTLVTDVGQTGDATLPVGSALVYLIDNVNVKSNVLTNVMITTGALGPVVTML